MIKEKLRKFIGLITIGCLTISLFFNNNVVCAATISVSGYDLVDSGGHLDYELLDTTYGTTVKSAASKWNAYKSGVIRLDSASTVCDVSVVDVYWDDSDLAGLTLISVVGAIYLNSYYLDNYTSSKKLNVCMHEFGHALGLDHNTKNDVMYGPAQSLTTLSANDKASYDAAAENY